ncbi:hypothetical protein SprV_0501870400 [Sparganum proliferum]
MLLVNVPGPMSFQQLKSVNGVTHTTFRGACQALNFLDNDQHWDVCINDACNTSHPRQIRTLFAIILTACSPSSPAELWEKYKSHMAEDILCRQRKQSTIVDFSPDIYNEALIMIEDMCTEIANKVLDQLGMPSPNRSAAASLHVDLRREENYNTLELLSYLQSNIPKLTLEQKGIYDQIMVTANNGVGGILFLDAPGGTAKTFLLRLILTAIRSKNDITVALASSGIAATLLTGGRTAHSALKLPLNVHFVETPMCNISKSSASSLVRQGRPTFFTFNGQVYEQKKGTQMGSPLSGLIAEAVLQRLERLVFITYPPKFWARYVDDTFVIIKRSDVQTFKALLNSIFPDIQFTMEEELKNQLAFLDVQVTKLEDGKIRRTVYRKANNTSRILHFKSNHPVGHKRSCVRTLFQRVQTHCSDENGRKEEINNNRINRNVDLDAHY